MADMEAIKSTISEVFDRMGFGDAVLEITAHQGTTSRIAVRLRGDARMLIGEHGANLAALEHVLRKIVQKKFGAEQRFSLDLNDYRMRRMEDLKQDVKAAAKEVRLYRRPVPLKPMSSFERRVVHLLLEEYPDITTESIGQDEERRVVIKPFAPSASL
ncbi:MAG: R3H domain-containing nucleic acid-binding protein [Patescibacteria group bacterium]